MHELPDRAPSVLMTLMHAAGEAEAHVESKLASIGLSLPKLAALTALRDAGESMPLGQLAERLSCVKSNITQLVDRLESDGFVKRLSDPHDRRTRLAVLTAAGRQVCEQGTGIQAAAEREIVAGLDSEETRQLSTLVAKLGRGQG